MVDIDIFVVVFGVVDFVLLLLIDIEWLYVVGFVSGLKVSVGCCEGSVFVLLVGVLLMLFVWFWFDGMFVGLFSCVLFVGV